jgi:hypothetical protein
MLKHFEIEQIEQLAKSVAALIHVTNSDNATKAILRQIERLAAGPVPGTPERTPIQERISTAKESSIRGLYGLFAELSRDPDTTLAELQEVAKALGHKNVGVITL